VVATDRAFRFALQAMPEHGGADWRSLARKAEDLGFATLQTADHLGLPDPFTPLVSAADATTSLRVGTLVLNNELHHPVLLARQAATVDLLSDGRLELGFGTGYALAEHRAMGIPLSAPGERVRRLTASVRIVKRLLAGEPVRDDVFGVDVESLGLSGIQRPHAPILVGGHGRAVLTLAMQEAQIVQLTGLVHAEDGTISAAGFARRTIAERVGWMREVAGVTFADLELSALVQVVAVGAGAAEEAARLAARTGYSVDELDASPFVLLGTVDAIVDKLLGLREELGITYFTVRDPDAFAPVVARLAGT
jgi:probable F420-dependent oxidoreductase